MKRTPILSLENKHYEPSQIEDATYLAWKKSGIFECNPDSEKPKYSIVIPPPNVTGRLHMGHALNNSIQDCLCRFKRMDGFDVLWVPGTDHAGISTQSVVKKHLDSEGIDFKSLGREEVISRIWQWKEKYGDQILLQLEKIGCSCDWSKTRFTMDEGLSLAVRTAFKRLYDDKLIYRGKYIVNWCPSDQTALSDDEVDTKEGGEPGFLWHIRYPLADGETYGGAPHITIATTRPETLLGDTAIAVNPKDPRYLHLHGKHAMVPLVNRRIPIIADDYVDSSFGSGCLKVTPAHDPNDFQIGVRHQLAQINVMNPDATMGDQAPERFHGIDRFLARDQIVQELQALDLINRIEERMTPVGRAQRSGAVIEYRLSDQWFVQMGPLAERALKASKQGEIKMFPNRWEKVFQHWLENSRDWCISRQIWWGHQIPAWHHKTNGKILVEESTPSEVLANPSEWEQDKDVLDTWFSSALWPFSTMGWPDLEAPLLKAYYPTAVLSTAKDIIYFWVARMAMTGLYFVKDIPFHHVYFHPVICDAKGETMSKSKGNGIDPIHVIAGATALELEGPIRDARPARMEDMLKELHLEFPNGFEGVGADALRLTLLSLNSQAQQVQITLKKFDEIGKRFVEKLWNASRYTLSNISSGPIRDQGNLDCNLENIGGNIEDYWITAKLNLTISEVRTAIDGYRFHEAITSILRFFWDDFCDWYLEISKSSFKDLTSPESEQKRKVLLDTYRTTLQLLHPFVPFITEELWSHLQSTLNNQGVSLEHHGITSGMLAESDFPKESSLDKEVSKKTIRDFDLLQSVIREIRSCKSQLGIAATSVLPCQFKINESSLLNIFKDNVALVEHTAFVSNLSFINVRPKGFISVILPGIDAFLDISQVLNIDAEIIRNQKLITKLEKERDGIQSRLSNKSFVERAPKKVIDETQVQANDLNNRIDKIKELIRDLSEEE